MPRQSTRQAAPFRSRALLLAAAALSLCGAARAQSLMPLYEAARGYDATYLSARALADSALYRARQADALKLPGVQATGALNRVDTTLPTHNHTTLNNQTVTVDASYPLFNRVNDTTWEQAQRALEVSSADLQTAEHDLMVRVAQAYFDVLGARDALAAAQQALNAVDEQLASAKRNFEVGTATITDTREAQARRDLARATLLVAENDLRTKSVALDQLVGRTGVDPRPLATPVALPPAASTPPDEWVSRALQSNPSIRKAELGLEVAQLETEKARAGHLPTVALIGRLQSSNSRGTAITDINGVTGATNAATIGVQLAVPIFSGYSVQNRIKETLLLEDKSRQDLAAARRAVSLGTRSAYLGAQSLEGQVMALEAAEASSKLALEATQLGYRVGVRVNIDVLNAQSQLFNTQRDLALARYNLLMTRLKLRQAAGTLLPTDLQALEALLR